MSQQPDAGSDEWPTKCARCGTDLVSGTVDFTQTPEVTESTDEERAAFQPGEMVAVDYCPNPDCPGKARDKPVQ